MMEKVLELIRQKHARKLFADMTVMDTVPNEDLLWTETDWFPRCLKAGLRYSAVVMPKSLASHMSIDKMSERIDPNAVTRRFFADPESASEWLAKQ